MSDAPSVTFDGSVRALAQTVFSDLHLRLAASCWTCLLGPSGAGKSTILRAIAGLELGVDFTGIISASNGRAVPPQVAYMAQDDLLLPWATVAANIGLGARLRGTAPDKTRLAQLVILTGLAGLEKRRPHTLSGGQRQRVALARTLMEEKQIILLDEPFSALDARTRADMQELATRLLADRTVLHVTHDPAEAARLGHSIFVLDEGVLQQIAPPQLAVPRHASDPAVLQCQVRLLTRLRDGAAA